MTKYVFTEVLLDAGIKFYVDGNSKVTRDNGTYSEPKPNAFSLPHILSCPNATPTCAGSCYVHGLRKATPDIWNKYKDNFETISKLGNSPKIAKQFGEWIKENCSGGFRWHVAGDVFAKWYWYWLADVSYYAQVPCWIYTRSFERIGNIPKNLIVNLSADRDNYKEALDFYKATGLRICYLSSTGEVPEDLPKGSVIFPDYELRGRSLDEPTTAPWWQSLSTDNKKKVCPADFFGQNEHHRCGVCKKCLT